MINCCELGKINNSSDFQDYETKAGASVVGLEFIRLGAGRQADVSKMFGNRLCMKVAQA